MGRRTRGAWGEGGLLSQKEHCKHQGVQMQLASDGLTAEEFRDSPWLLALPERVTCTSEIQLGRISDGYIAMEQGLTDSFSGYFEKDRDAETRVFSEF